MNRRTDRDLAILAGGALLMSAVAAFWHVWDAAGAAFALALALGYWARRR